MKQFGEGVIDTYTSIIKNALQTRTTITQEEKQKQLEYHTLYLFQVLTLDRGTTSGLLIHNQNDVGIMGSLPSHINIADSVAENGVIDVTTKERLAQVVREHYKKHPQALSMQASGNTIPSTVANHKE